MTLFLGELDVAAAVATDASTAGAVEEVVGVATADAGSGAVEEIADVATAEAGSGAMEEVAEVATTGAGSFATEEDAFVATAEASVGEEGDSTNAIGVDVTAEAAVEVAAEVADVEMHASMSTNSETAAVAALHDPPGYVPTEEERIAAGRHEQSRKRPMTSTTTSASGSGASSSASGSGGCAMPIASSGSGPAEVAQPGGMSAFVWEVAAKAQAERDAVQMRMDERIKEIQRENAELQKRKMLDERTTTL